VGFQITGGFMAYFINALLVFTFLILFLLLFSTVAFGSALLVFGRADKKREKPSLDKD
jgi:hypothetical protein